MKKRKFRKIAITLGLSLVMLITSTASSFAESQSIPMVLNLKEKVIDVSVPDKFTMKGKAKKTELEISPLVVTNNASGNSLYLLEVKYGGDVSPWTLVPDSTNFAGLNKNQHKYSLVIEGTDLKEGAKSYSEEIAPKGSYSIAMTGKTGLSTEAASIAQAGSLVLTVGLDFLFCLTDWFSYYFLKAVDGMTWAEWLESKFYDEALELYGEEAVGMRISSSNYVCRKTTGERLMGRRRKGNDVGYVQQCANTKICDAENYYYIFEDLID